MTIFAQAITAVLLLSPVLGETLSDSNGCGLLFTRTTCIAATQPVFSDSDCSTWKCSSDSIDALSGGCCLTPADHGDAWKTLNDTVVLFIGASARHHATSLVRLLSGNHSVDGTASRLDEYASEDNLYSGNAAVTVLSSNLFGVSSVLSELRRYDVPPALGLVRLRPRSVVVLSLGVNDFVDYTTGVDSVVNGDLFVEHVLSTVSSLKSQGIVRVGMDTLIVQLPRAVRPDEVDLSWSVSLEAVNEQLYEVGSALDMAMRDVHVDVAVVDMAWTWKSWSGERPMQQLECMGKRAADEAEFSQLMYAMKLMGCRE
jgi:hypothetical protein